MNHILSDRINNLATSQTLAMAALARELKAQGKDIISLSLGEPDFNTPDFIKEAAKKAIDENYSTYSPVDGYAELKEAICRKFKRDNDLDYKPANIVVSTGAKQSLYNIAQVMLNDGDEVKIGAHTWRVVVGSGHSPEHACLYCPELKLNCCITCIRKKNSLNLTSAFNIYALVNIMPVFRKLTLQHI